MNFSKVRVSYLIIIAIAYFANKAWRKPTIPEHLLNHPTKFIHDFISKDQAKRLLERIKNLADFPCNAQDTEFYDVAYEHVGEAEPINKDGTCNNAFLIPNKKRTHCILPGRIDVAKHFMKYGGIEGMKENYETSSSRVMSFGRYMFDLDKFPEGKELFESESFKKESLAICPADKQVLDPFQANFIIQVPGQSVALHLDAVYFEDATRFQYPQWLLAVMKHSGLYEDKFIDQIQVVGYLHEWNSTTRGGKFAYWLSNDITPHYELPVPRAGSVVDGSKVIHASTIYMPKMRPPIMKTSADNRLQYLGNDKWQVVSDKAVLKKYKTDDLRITIVYRARCFETEEKRIAFNQRYKSTEGVRHVKHILEELKSDMITKRHYTKETLDETTPLDFAMMLLHEYLAYPVPPKAFIPFNYCLLDKISPWTAPYVKYFCDTPIPQPIKN